MLAVVTLVEAVGPGIDIGKLPDALLAAGIHSFTAKDAAEVAGIKPSSAWPALARLARNRLAFSPARGLYVPIPPEYRSWGVVPAAWFIDALMGHLGRDYYVGYLSAAEIHGAAHQRPQVFQVVVDHDVRDRSFGRVRLRFITNRDMASLPSLRRNTPTGTMAVSTPALTALDLANRPENGGALHNVATVLIELAEDGKLDDAALAELVARFPLAASRRVGWIVEHFTDVRLDHLADAILADGDRPSKLDQHGPRRGKVDPRWRVRVNTVVEPDV
ncbi:MAG: type IV toxin-antitoxin system AbiEi family antitoxin domain-containing protein [Acidimicrobiia bacterium]